MQNKPNLLDALMNVSSLITVDYKNKSNWKLGENKPNQTQSQGPTPKHSLFCTKSREISGFSRRFCHFGPRK